MLLPEENTQTSSLRHAFLLGPRSHFSAVSENALVALNEFDSSSVLYLFLTVWFLQQDGAALNLEVSVPEDTFRSASARSLSSHSRCKHVAWRPTDGTADLLLVRTDPLALPISAAVGRTVKNWDGLPTPGQNVPGSV
jgi:hypothetical protein